MGAFEFGAYRASINPEDSDCNRCIGACCRAGVVLELSAPEAEYLTKQGSVLRPLTDNELPKDLDLDIHPDKKHYAHLSDCGNLDQETQQCKDYEKRPQVCRELRAGSFPCEMIQMKTAQQLQSGSIDLGLPGMRFLEDSQTLGLPEYKG